MSTVLNNNNNNNNFAICREEEIKPRKFIKSSKFSKKEDRLSKDKKSHKSEHQKRVAKRIQERVNIHKVYQLKTDKYEDVNEDNNEDEKKNTQKFRMPESKKAKVDNSLKRQPKINVRENLLDRWEDVEFAEQDDLWSTYDEIFKDQCEYYWVLDLPEEIDYHRKQYEKAKMDLQLEFYDISTKFQLEAIVTRYENNLRLKELKAQRGPLTLEEYEKKRARLNAMWIEFKRYGVPRYIFDGAMEYEENQKRLEICELEPIPKKMLARQLKANLQEYEEILQQYFMEREGASVELETCDPNNID